MHNSRDIMDKGSACDPGSSGTYYHYLLGAVQR